MDDESTGMLINSYSTVMGQMGDSISLEISIALRSLSMSHASNLTMHPMTLTLYSATHSKAHNKLHNSHSSSTLYFLNWTMSSSHVPCAFYSHLHFTLIISKSMMTIMTKYDNNDTKSVGNLTFLMVESTINAHCFNKCRQPTVLTTWIYYLIWPTHNPAVVASGRLSISTKSILAQPLLLGLPCYSETILFFHSASSSA